MKNPSKHKWLSRIPGISCLLCVVAAFAVVPFAPTVTPFLLAAAFPGGLAYYTAGKLDEMDGVNKNPPQGRPNPNSPNQGNPAYKNPHEKDVPPQKEVAPSKPLSSLDNSDQGNFPNKNYQNSYSPYIRMNEALSNSDLHVHTKAWLNEALKEGYPNVSLLNSTLTTWEKEQAYKEIVKFLHNDGYMSLQGKQAIKAEFKSGLDVNIDLTLKEKAQSFRRKIDQIFHLS